MHFQMNHDRLKRKYLRRAHQLLHTKSKKPSKWKLQASVEPFVHTRDENRPPLFERSASDPTKSTPISTHYNCGPDSHITHHPTEWTATCSATDTCSESDTQSVHSPLLHGGGSNSQFTTGNSHEIRDSGRYHPQSRRPFPHIHDDIQSSSSTSPHLLFVSPSERTYKHLSPTGSESAQLYDTLLYRPQGGPIANEVYPLSSTPLASNRYHHIDMQESGNKKCSELDSKLKVQMKVNQELKRLLVASVGGDLQLRLEQVVQEKATLSHDLETSQQQLAETSEDMDQISIECDIWRSKFLASRLMIDELASWKAELSLQYKESQRALQCLLREHDELKNMLTKCNEILREETNMSNCTSEAFATKSGWNGSVVSLKTHEQQHFQSSHSTVLDLAKVSLNYAKSIQDKTQSLGKTTRNTHNQGKPADTSLHNVPIEPTVGEKLAKQVLMSRQQFLKSQSRTFPLPLQLDDDKLLYQRGMSHRGFSPLTGSSLLFGQSDNDVPCYCRCCKGKVICV